MRDFYKTIYNYDVRQKNILVGGAAFVKKVTVELDQFTDFINLARKSNFAAYIFFYTAFQTAARARTVRNLKFKDIMQKETHKGY